MGFFDNIFGGNKNTTTNGGSTAAPTSGKSQHPPPPPPPAPKPAGGSAGGGGGAGSTVASVQSMERTMETLDRKQAQLEQKITEQEEKAKQYMAAGKKPMAINCMKLKKQYEDQIEKLLAQRMNLQTTQFALETAEMNRVVMNEQQRAAAELQRVSAQMDPDKVQDVMDSVQEQIQNVKDANNALAQPIDMEMADDDDAEEALKALMKADKQSAGAVAAPVATASVKQKSAADAAAEAELARLMGGVNVPGQVKNPNGKVDASKSAVSEEEELLAQLQLS
jgi:charged multivesicular body protein 4A/B